MKERPTIIDFARHYTQKYADRTYLLEKPGDEWIETSYATTWEESCLLASGFMALGLRKGDRVSLLSEGRNSWIFAEFGILFAGGVDVPLSFKLESDHDLIFRINHSDSIFVVASAGQIGKIRRVRSQLTNVRKVILLDDIPLQEDEILLSDVLKMGADFNSAHPGALEERMASVGPDDYANISYTSGTTADPKGVILTHRNYTANVDQADSVVKLKPSDVMLIITPLDHCFAHVCGMYVVMRGGARLATVPGGRNPVTMLKNIPVAIREVRPTMMLSVPAISRNFRKNIEAGIHKKGKVIQGLYNFALSNAIAYNREYYNAGRPCLKLFWRLPIKWLMDALIFKSIRKSFGGRLGYFVGGGALLDIELQRYFCAIGMPIFQGYGLTESTPVICSNAKGAARFGSSGRIVSNLEVRICDESGAELPVGKTGEIVVRGENVMAGYWKNPEATASAIRGGWLYTGDRGYICPNDYRYLYVTGRFKSLLISSDGEKYSPEGYEDSLADGSRYIDSAVLYNNQSPYTVVLVIPAKQALRDAVSAKGLDPLSPEGLRAQLDIIQGEVDSYRPGGRHAGLFPEKWLPAAVVVGDTPFTEQNGMLNSTSKMVRGKVEKYYADRFAYAMTAEGKQLGNERNIESLK